MAKRKVIKHGPSTYIISLPSKWVKQHNIQKGDELEVETEDGKVIIYTEKGIQVGKIEIDITGLDRSSVSHLIRSLYKIGYDEIRLLFQEPSTIHYRLNHKRSYLSVIHEEVNRLTGMEVIQQKEKFCVIKALSEMSSSEFDDILRRIFLLLIDASHDLVSAVENQDIILLHTLEEKHNTITKFLSFCMRLLNKRGYVDSRKSSMIYNILNMIDKIADIIKNTSRQLLNSKIKISVETKKVMAKVHETIIIFYELFYKYNQEKVMKISYMRDTLVNDAQLLIEKIDKKEIVIIDNYVVITELLMSMCESRIGMQY